MSQQIVLIGEAWGENEERERAPFVGATGHELTRMLKEAGIRRGDCFLTNVFNLRPNGNKIETLCGGKAYGIPGYPPLIQSKYVRSIYERELKRLRQELLEVRPNVVVAMGNTACWALLGRTAITKLRGTTQLSTHTVSGLKVLPTYHPAAILRLWELRPVAVMDLTKAKRESESPKIIRPEREIWIEPTLEDIYEFHSRYIATVTRIAIDIETSGRMVTCFGIAASERVGMVIPFADSRKSNRRYWRDEKSERQAWEYIRRVCEGDCKKIFQNGLYDIAFLYRAYGIKVYNAEHDTMLLHHALQPESLKSLGFLGSIYTNEGSWKQMREKHTTIKRDD